MLRKTMLAAALGATVALGLAACGSSSDSSTSATAAASTTAGQKTTYPVTVRDCGGTATTYEAAPKRVVTVDPNLTEMLLLLGLKDRIAGFTQFYAPDQVWPPVKAQMAALDQINKGGNYPSKEAVLGKNPDLVASVYPYAFQQPLPTRSEWRKLGVSTYQALGECTPGANKGFAGLYRDLRNLGVIFNVQDKAEQEIAKLQARVAAQQQRVKQADLKPRLIATHGGGSEHPDAYGPTTAAVVGLTGSKYLFGDLPLDQIPSWEQFVKANPDTIWVIPDAGPSVSQIKRQLETRQGVNQVTAVRRGSYVVVPQADATVESPRNVDGLTKLVTGLIALQQSGR